MNRVLVIGMTAVIAAGIGYFAGNHQGGSEAAPPQSALEPPVQPPSALSEYLTGIESAGSTRANALKPASQGVAGSNPHAHFTHFRVGNRNVKAILPDGDIMWVGTSGGVIRYNSLTDDYQRFDVSSGLLANGVFHLSKLQDRLVVGTYGGGLSLLKENGSGWDNYNIPEGLADAFVYDVLEADNGDVWIATWSGANRIAGGELDNPGKWETFTVKNTAGGLPNDWVYAMERGEKGEIWMATEGGLARYRNGEWSNWNHEHGLGAPYEMVRDQITFTNDPAKFSKHHARQKTEMGLEQVDVAYNPNYIVSLVVDAQGIVWCGTWGGGLARFDGSQWRNYTMADGLPSNHIFALSQDAGGEFWVGTSDGLARKEGDNFKIFTTRDGLFSNSVFSMAQDRQNRRWVGSFGGVARIDNLL